MPFMRWDPLRDLMEFQERMNRLFDVTFARARREEVPSRSAWTPPVDIYEIGDEIVIDVELPEVNVDDLSVDVEGNVLTIRGEKPPSREANPEQYHLFERWYGPFRRSFTLPYSLDPEEIKGSYKNGILTLRMPKRAKPQRIAIEE
jgi:HSP20 family protein